MLVKASRGCFVEKLVLRVECRMEGAQGVGGGFLYVVVECRRRL
jgi:hypothetical protein